jgi:hypothetical protein
VTAIRPLGGECRFNQSFGVLTVKLPDGLPAPHVNVLALERA